MRENYELIKQLGKVRGGGELGRINRRERRMAKADKDSYLSNQQQMDMNRIFFKYSLMLKNLPFIPQKGLAKFAKVKTN